MWEIDLASGDVHWDAEMRQTYQAGPELDSAGLQAVWRERVLPDQERIRIDIFLRDNLPQRGDLRWLTRLGGAIGGGTTQSFSSIDPAPTPGVGLGPHAVISALPVLGDPLSGDPPTGPGTAALDQLLPMLDRFDWWFEIAAP